MIRSTLNGGTSSKTKQRHATGALTTTGVKGQSFELIETDEIGIEEVRDEFDDHFVSRSEFPSNAFRGTFE